MRRDPSVSRIGRHPDGGHAVSAGEDITYRIARWNAEGSEISLTTLKSQRRRRGAARRALENLAAHAQVIGCPVWLEARPFGAGGPDAAALETFYASIGFVPEHGHGLMVLRP